MHTLWVIAIVAIWIQIIVREYISFLINKPQLRVIKGPKFYHVERLVPLHKWHKMERIAFNSKSEAERAINHYKSLADPKRDFEETFITIYFLPTIKDN